MPTTPLRAAIIGTSHVGSTFDDRFPAGHELIPSSHASCYAIHPRTQLVAGCDLIPERLAAFGSTACKATWRCLDCREPFEHFKPI